MDVRIEAAPMEAEVEMPEVTVTVVEKVAVPKAIVAVSQVVSFSCPSIAGHSLSAVAPDYINFREELAKAA